MINFQNYLRDCLTNIGLLAISEKDDGEVSSSLVLYDERKPQRRPWKKLSDPDIANPVKTFEQKLTRLIDVATILRRISRVPPTKVMLVMNYDGLDSTVLAELRKKSALPMFGNLDMFNELSTVDLNLMYGYGVHPRIVPLDDL